MNSRLIAPALSTVLAASLLAVTSPAAAQTADSPAGATPAPAPDPAETTNGSVADSGAPAGDTQGAPAAAPSSAVSAPPEAHPVPDDEGEPASLSGTFSLLGGVGYSYGFATALGVGVRGQFAIVPKGFLHSLAAPMHDELTLEPGLDYFRVGYGSGTYETTYSEITPLVGVEWNFWINDSFVVYPKVDVGLRFGSWTTSYAGVTSSSLTSITLYFQAAAGAAYRIGPVALRAEVGWQAFRAGVGVDLF